MNAELHQTAADPWTKPTDLSHWPAFRQLWNYTCTIAIIITHPESWYSFYHPTDGRRLSRPRWLVNLYTQTVYLPVSSYPSKY